MIAQATCSICSGSGIDPDFLDPCAGCQPGSLPSAAPREIKPLGPSDKQQAFFDRLAAELLEADPSKAERIEALRSAFAGGSIREASQLIDFVKILCADARQAASARRIAEIEPGLYRKDGRIVRVQPSKTGHLYAQILNEQTRKYEYIAGAMRHLSPADRIGLAEAIEVTRRIGRCCICCRSLKNPDSVDAGIGPICASKI